MHRYRHLMVELGRAEGDAALVRYAARIAALGTAAEVRFVHVLPDGNESIADADRERIRGELLALTQPHFATAGDRVRISCDVLAGPLVDQLLAHAAEHQVDVIFVGDRRGQSGRRAHARRLAMKAPCSVWILPEQAPAGLRRILVPVDFSEHSADTMRVATALAKFGSQAQCLALHVYFDEAVATYDGYDLVLRGREEHAYHDFISRIDCQGVEVTPVFEEGPNVAHAIGRVAEQQHADLIVMGTRGRSRSAAILLGSVTEEVMMETRVPLLAVKHFGAQMGLLQVLLDRDFRQRGAPHT